MAVPLAGGGTAAPLGSTRREDVMRTRTLITGSPTTSMAVWGNIPYGQNGADLSASTPFRLLIMPVVLGPAATPRQLTPAGIQAAIARINTYVAALSAANRDLLFRTFPVGAEGLMSVAAQVVTYPVLNMTDALAEATAWATLIGTGANVETF